MNWAAALLLAQAGVITAQSLAAIEAEVGQDQTGAWRCSLSPATGDTLLDDRLCRAAQDCGVNHGNDRRALAACQDWYRAGILADYRANQRATSGERAR